MTQDSTTSISSASPKRLKLPASSLIPILPPKPDYAAVAEACTRTETNLLRWLDYIPEPTLEQLDVSSKVIWRLAAVRKTLSLVGLKKKPNALVPKQLTQTMLELERLMAKLGPPPPKPKSPRQPPNPFAPYPPYPPLPPLPPLSPLYPREQREQAQPPASSPETPASSSQPLASSLQPLASVSACPELHNPMHTVQAADRQVNQLCKDSGVPTPPPDPTPEPPATPNEPDSSHRSYESHKSYSSDPTDPTDPSDSLGRPHPADPSDPEDVPDIRVIAAYVENLYQHVRAKIGPLPPMHPKAFDLCPELRRPPFT